MAEDISLDLGCYGMKDVKIPTLDNMAKIGGNLIMFDFFSEGNSSEHIKIKKKIPGNISKTISDYRSEKGPLIISPSDRSGKRILLFDYCEVSNGSMQLDIIGPAGLKVEIWSAPYILNNESNIISLILILRMKLFYLENVIFGKRPIGNPQDIWE